MTYEESNIVNNLLSLTFLGLCVQNIILLVAVPLVSESSIDESNVFSLALTIDLIFILMLGILALVKIIQSEGDSKQNWILIIIGTGLFIYFSLFWRVNLDIFSSYLQNILDGIIPSIHDTNTSGFDALAGLLFAIQLSNAGLLLISLGLFFEYDHLGKYRYLILVYGIVNFVLTIGGPLIIFKFFTTIFAIPYYLKLTFNMSEEWFVEV